MSDIVKELDESAKRQLAFAPDYIDKSLEYLAAREIERLRAEVTSLKGNAAPVVDWFDDWMGEYDVVMSKAAYSAAKSFIRAAAPKPNQE